MNLVKFSIQLSWNKVLSFSLQRGICWLFDSLWNLFIPAKLGVKDYSQNFHWFFLTIFWKNNFIVMGGLLLLWNIQISVLLTLTWRPESLGHSVMISSSFSMSLMRLATIDSIPQWSCRPQSLLYLSGQIGVIQK